jgi:gluconolactonase
MIFDQIGERMTSIDAPASWTDHPDVLSPPRVLTRDIGFTEGPVWTGREVVVTSITRGRLYAVPLDGGEAVGVADPGGGPNGLAYDAATGRTWIAQNGRVHMPPRASVADRTAGVQSWAPGEPVITHHEDPGSAPNDCVFGPDGRLWFTNPAGDPHEGAARTGSVCAMDVVTGDVEVLWRTDGYPNGLAFGPDPEQFLLAETRYARIVELRWRHGVLQPTGRAIGLAHGFPDGFAVSDDGHVLVAGTSSGAVDLFDAGFAYTGSVDLGERSMPTNVCFAGAGLDRVVVTLAQGGRVVMMESGLTGLALLTSGGAS